MKRVFILFLIILLFVSCEIGPNTRKEEGMMRVINGTGRKVVILITEEGQASPTFMEVSTKSDQIKAFSLKPNTPHSLTVSLLHETSTQKIEETIVTTEAMTEAVNTELSANETVGFIVVSLENGELELKYSWKD